MQDLATLATRIIRYRGKHKLSQEKFAKLCGITPQTICKIENGKSRLFKSTEQRIIIFLEEQEKKDETL